MRSEAQAASASAAATLRTRIDRDRARIAAGERPTYHVQATTSIDGSVDVRIAELPLIHLYVPDSAGVLDGARVLIARTLGVDEGAFELRGKGPVD